MPAQLSESQRTTLRVLVDTVVPAVERPDDPHGFWRRKATDIGVDAMLEEAILGLPEDQVEGLLELLDGLEAQGFEHASQRSREQLMRNIALLGAEGAAGVNALTGLTLFLHYGAPIDPQTGQNPNWRTFGYPGPISAPPQRPKALEPLVPDGDELTLEVDACVVGSGAGGAVTAAELAGQGMKVVVLEAGGYFDESDFKMLEIPAYQEMYWRGGPTPTADMNITLQAGATLGGGTTINWTNCLRTQPWVREQWAREHGLEGVDGPEYDVHLDAVLERISANDRCSDLNPPQERMKVGAEKLGWSFATIVRNADPATYDPASAGYLGFGDQSGSKQSTQKTYLVDAAERGAEILVGCWAERVLVEEGRAAGVAATWSERGGGRTAAVTVRAPIVVVAAGSLESPALLLRSRIGGPATGDYLRLHPCTATFGVYPEDMRAWWGAPHAGLVNEFADLGDGYGYLIEGAQYAPAIAGSAIPFTTAAEHKQFMADYRYAATFIGLLRDRGHGRVTVDEQGFALPWYSLIDELDVRNTHRALESQIRLHAAAGADRIATLGAGLPVWHRGSDLEAYIARVKRIPLRAGGMRLFAAHQMGSCRMGRDPASSVADTRGELHDTSGVWIGDASAFPTPSGTNPMVSIMALARRTAGQIVAAAGARAEPVAAPARAG